MTEKPLTDLDGNILKGIVWKKFKEDDVDFVDFWELDPDLIGWLKWSKPKVDPWWKSSVWAPEELEEIDNSFEIETEKRI